MAEYTGDLFDEKPQVGVEPSIKQDEFQSKKQGLRKEYENKKKADQTTTMFGQDIPSFFTSPVGMIVEGGLLTLAAQQAAKTAPKIMGGIKNRLIGSSATSPTQSTAAATSMDAPTVDSMVQNKLTGAPIVETAQTTPTIEDLKQRSADLTESVQGKIAPPTGTTPQAIPPQFGPAGASVGDIPPAPPFQPSVEAAVATGGNVDQAIKQTVAKELDQAAGVSPEILKTGTGREVVAGQGSVPQRFAKEYKSPTDVPKGYAFVPGAQYIDVLRNDLGQGTYTQQYTGREFPQTYPGAVEEAKNINRELNRPTREQLKAQGAALPETTEGIVRKVGPNKMVKVGGVAGALISLADIAKAENTQQRREAAGNALLGFLPPGMDVNSLNANEAAQLQQLFAQQAYAQQVGGGRGVAPPSAYPQGGLNYNSPRIR